MSEKCEHDFSVVNDSEFCCRKCRKTEADVYSERINELNAEVERKKATIAALEKENADLRSKMLRCDGKDGGGCWILEGAQ